MLDLNLFREEKGGNPEIIRESQRRRFANVSIVDEIIQLDHDWRKCQFELDSFRKDFNKITKAVARLKMTEKDTSEMIKESVEKKKSIADKEMEVKKVKAELYDKLNQVGNLIHDSVPVDSDEVNNVVIRTWEETKRSELELKTHVQLVELLGIVDSENGSNVAGGRGYYMIGDGVSLVLGLIHYGIAFLASKGYKQIMTPYFMHQNVMAKCAQLAEFDEELYKVKTLRSGITDFSFLYDFISCYARRSRQNICWCHGAIYAFFDDITNCSWLDAFNLLPLVCDEHGNFFAYIYLTLRFRD